jgi:hypothetical protein
MVGTPIEFEARIVKPKGVNLDETAFIWNFGDGSESRGRAVSHTYFFKGDYTVLVNSVYYGEKAVDRLKIKVVENSLTIKSGDGFVEIENTGSLEANIGRWMIKTDKGNFIFPQDTIVLGQNSIKVPIDTTKLWGANEFALISPSQVMLAKKRPVEPQYKNMVGLVAGVFEANINIGVDKIVFEKRMREELENWERNKNIQTKISNEISFENNESLLEKSAKPSTVLPTSQIIANNPNQISTTSEIFVVKKPQSKGLFNRLIGLFKD